MSVQVVQKATTCFDEVMWDQNEQWKPLTVKPRTTRWDDVMWDENQQWKPLSLATNNDFSQPTDGQLAQLSARDAEQLMKLSANRNGIQVAHPVKPYRRPNLLQELKIHLLTKTVAMLTIIPGIVVLAAATLH